MKNNFNLCTMLCVGIPTDDCIFTKYQQLFFFIDIKLLLQILLFENIICLYIYVYKLHIKYMNV